MKMSLIIIRIIIIKKVYRRKRREDVSPHSLKIFPETHVYIWFFLVDVFVITK